MGLEGKVALITGGGRGIGRAVAIGYAKEGAKGAIAARSADQLEETSRVIKDAGGTVLSIQADVSEESESERMVKETIDGLGPVDILVNNAGIGPATVPRENNTTWTWPVEVFDLLFKVNMRGAFLTLRSCLPHMVERGSGSVINVSSRTGFQPRLNNLYGLSKGAMHNLGFSSAEELRSFGIACNNLTPGGMIDTYFQIRQAPEGRAKLNTPEVMVPICIWLAQQTAETVTGEHFEATKWNNENGFGHLHNPAGPQFMTSGTR